MSFIAVTGTLFGSGIITAIEVLCVQAYRSRSYRLVGITLQRGVWVLGIAVLLVWAIWINAEALLLIMKQKREIARLSQLFVFIWFPALVADFSFVLIQRYLQIQGVFKPVIYVGVVANVMHLGINVLLVQGVDMGFQGVALASCLTYCLFLGVSVFFYLFCLKLYQKTWPVEGWTIESLQHWGQFTTLAVPGILMLCIEWWSFEVGTFLMGTFGKMQLAAHGILMQFSSFVYMVCLTLSVFRVRNALGMGDHIKAKHITKISIVTICCFTALLSVFLIALREHLGKAFTSDSEIVGLVSKVTPAMTGFAFFLSVQVICCGIIRGCGRPRLGLFLNFIFYYCVALPLGSGFAFYVFKVGVEGYWWGLTIGLALQSFAFIAILWRMDWNKYVKKARHRLASQRPTSLLSWSTGNERGDEENLVVTWLSRTSSLFSVNTNSFREFTNPPNPVMSWIYRSSSLLSLDTTPLRAMNRHHEQVLLEDAPSGRDRLSVTKQQLRIDGNKMTSKKKRTLILRRLVWLMFALLVLLTAVVVRVTIPLPVNESHKLTAWNMTGPLTNLTNT
ncbi:hypothetical protein OS493_004928 [Desmophyllum pertusum]|uniref:Multidrug and toxin extrusion protein n=1 Tax=Desmophyllum pertusum TaxID=174260 RepID=A0A9W9Z454_9CNID|nr:hypothetical protein OS493_004928 [Desmophyllum pertusum]